MSTNTKTSAPQTSAKDAKAAASNAHILDLIGKVQSGYGKAQEVAQAAALAVLMHAKEYGDCSKAPLLARAIPARERNSLIGWFKMFSPIRIRLGRAGRGGTVGEDKVRLAKSGEQDYAPFDVKKAEASPWFNDPAGANPVPAPLDTLGDFEQNLRNRLKNAAKAAKDGKRFIPTQTDNVVSFADHMLKAMDAFDKANPAPVEATNANGTAQPRQAASA